MIIITDQPQVINEIIAEKRALYVGKKVSDKITKEEFIITLIGGGKYLNNQCTLFCFLKPLDPSKDNDIMKDKEPPTLEWMEKHFDFES